MKQGEIIKQVDQKNAYFTISWSNYAKADKYSIIRAVPAIGGIAELYFKDKEGKLNLFCVARSYYGGLRATLREQTDPEVEKDEYRRGILLEHKDEIWYRWAHTESQDDMTDLLFFFMETYAPDARVTESSGRYENIFVKEIDADRVVSTR